MVDSGNLAHKDGNVYINYRLINGMYVVRFEINSAIRDIPFHTQDAASSFVQQLNMYGKLKRRLK